MKFSADALFVIATLCFAVGMVCGLWRTREEPSLQIIERDGVKCWRMLGTADYNTAAYWTCEKK